MTAAAATPTVTSPTKHWGAHSPIHDSFQIWKIGRILFRVVAVVNVKLYRRRHYWNNYLIAVIFDICGSNLPSAGVSAASSCYCSQNHFVWAFLNRNYFRSCFVCFSFFLKFVINEQCLFTVVVVVVDVVIWNRSVVDRFLSLLNGLSHQVDG